MTLKILQFGTTGQLATELLRQAPAHDVAITALSRADCDLADPEAAARKVVGIAPDLVVIAAAYTAVDLAETEQDLARTINAAAPDAIARACAASGAALVNISTDYVFDGAGGAPYAEDAATHPLNIYGLTKLEGERAVLAACDRAVNIRTSWVVSAHGKNFVKTMLRVGAAGNPLRVVDDQRGRPTSAALGTSGKAGLRLLPETIRALMRPPLIWAADEPRPSNIMSTCPPTRSRSDGPAPV